MWSANCVITDKVYREARPNNNPAEINAPTNATFTITDTKLYVPVVTLLTEDDYNLLQQLKQDFKKLLNGINTDQICLIRQKKLNYLVDPTFNKVNRLFLLSFENEDERFSYSKYYTLTVEIKVYNVLIKGESFLIFQ